MTLRERVIKRIKNKNGDKIVGRVMDLFMEAFHWKHGHYEDISNDVLVFLLSGLDCIPSYVGEYLNEIDARNVAQGNQSDNKAGES